MAGFAAFHVSHNASHLAARDDTSSPKIPGWIGVPNP